MNIFILDKDPIIAAQMHCDKHVVKMVVEAAQLLSNAMYSVDLVAPYKKTHYNHPCSIWARTSLANYQWLWAHADALGKEYTVRYGKIHLSHTKILSFIPNTIDLSDNGLTDFANCTPYKDESNVIIAYHKYYNNDKRRFAKWKLGNVPEWFLPPIIYS